MRPLRRFLTRLVSIATHARNERRIEDEIRDHLAFLTAENMRAGMSPAEARRQALLKFGAAEAVKESYRDQSGLPSFESLLQDTRHALRRLRLAPAFTAAAILTLALGIGATTSIFTLVHAVLLSSLPVSNPGELYRVGKETHCCYLGGYSQDGGFSLVSYDLYKYLRDNTKGFAELAAVPSIEHSFGVRRSGSPEAAQVLPGEFVSGNYFAMFGIRPYAGRKLMPSDDRPGAPPVAVMSYRLWEKYGGDRSLIGGVFRLDDKPFTVVGVAPAGFYGDTLRGTPPDFFLPLNDEPYVETASDLAKYDTHWLNLIGRIQPGASPRSIESQMRVLLRQWLRSHWGEMSATDRAKLSQQTLFLSPGGAGITMMREQYGHWLHILMAATALVLLIVCANIASLMLVRGMERRRQISLSVALGARGSRVAREPLIESIALSVAGGAAGLVIAFACTSLILHFAFPAQPGSAPIPIDAAPSVPVLLFALMVSLATGVVFGAAPAWMAARADPIEALRGAGRSTTRAGLLPRKALVVVQAALALVLLSAAGLLSATLRRLETKNLGFEPAGRLVADINPRFAGYGAAQLPALYRRIHDSIARIPGVDAVALCLYSPPSGGWGSGVWFDGRRSPASADDDYAAWNRVSAGYFEAVGTPVLRGRGISEEDTSYSRKIAVVNESFARRYFKNDDAVGRTFGWKPGAPREFEIVGVVKNARYWPYRLDGPTDPMFFLPEAQADYSQTNIGSLFLKEIVVSFRHGADVPADAIRGAIASVDRGMPLIRIRSMKEKVAAEFAQQRLIARLQSLFAALSLLLASIGLYGVTAYNTGLRVKELGVRVALGAGRGDVVRLVLRGALRLIVTGLLIGIPAAFAAGRFLGNQLYGLSPYNPAVTLTAALALAASAVIAALIPALRACSLSAVDTLRTE